MDSLFFRVSLTSPAKVQLKTLEWEEESLGIPYRKKIKELNKIDPLYGLRVCLDGAAKALTGKAS